MKHLILIPLFLASLAFLGCQNSETKAMTYSQWKKTQEIRAEIKDMKKTAQEVVFTKEEQEKAAQK